MKRIANKRKQDEQTCTAFLRQERPSSFRRFSPLNSCSSMGARRSGSGGGRGNAGILKERANMSFMLVVMFFAVFGLIVLTEIFLIDERRGVNVSGTGALGGHRNGHRLPAAPDRPDYGEIGVSLNGQVTKPFVISRFSWSINQYQIYLVS
ncbi:hypothetical protein M0804_004418 [Polistes exclamans]|nr:hypothetical protein M0804_004418 [Polistes exclamans]